MSLKKKVALDTENDVNIYALFLLVKTWDVSRSTLKPEKKKEEKDSDGNIR